MSNPDVTPEMAEFIKMYQAAKAAGVLGQKHDAGTTPVTPYYDTGGIFSYPYSEESMLSAIQQPMSFIDYLPVRASRVRNSVSEILTAQMDATGENPANDCGTPMKPGYLLTCRVLTEMGHLYLGSETVSVSNVAMLDTFATRERRMVNGAAFNSPLLPDPLRRTFNAASETAIQLMKLGTQVKRSIATIECIGDESTTGGSREAGWIKEFDGLDQLIGAVTDVSGEACPAASSLVETFGAAYNASSGGRTLPQLMIQMYRSRVELADQVNYVNPNFAWVMPKSLWGPLLELWACSYASVRCSGTQYNEVGRELAMIESMANDMRRGRYLEIDGNRVPVLFTSGAEVDDSDLPWSGSIYLVPFRNDHTYLEYYPYNHELVTEFIQTFAGDPRLVTPMNNGLYLMTRAQTRGCFEIAVHSQMRLMLKARFLAARIDDIEWNPDVGYRDWDPNGSSFYSGGTSSYTADLT